MKISYYFLFITLSISMLSCQSRQDKALIVGKEVETENNIDTQSVIELDTLAECTITNEEDRLRKELFPFEFRDFNVSGMKRYFADDAIVDSASFSNEGYTYMIYKFKKAGSYFSFFVKPKEESPWFYIDETSIDNNLIQFKNGISIGMPKNDVFTILGIQRLNCDTLHIQEGDLFTYYDFIFEANRLKRIIIIPSE